MKPYPRQIGVGGLVISDDEKRLVREVLDSNQLTYGPYTRRFEQEFAARHNCAFGLFMNSGTSALHVALAAMKEHYGWQDGDEVLVPSVTFVATCNVVLHNRLSPVMVDVDPETFNMDAGQLERHLSPRTRAILPVHLLGLPADMGRLMELAEANKLKVLEDSCETMFATYRGRPVGSFGDAGCFSTYVAHFLVTGVGGFAITQQPELASLMRSLMNHGRDGIYISSNDDAGLHGAQLQQVIARRFSFIHCGHSFRCTELEAALGLGQLARSEDIIARRKQIADRFSAELAPLAEHLQLPVCPPDRTHTYMLYGLVARCGQKQDLVHYLEDLNIETRDLLPLTNQPVYRTMFPGLEDRYPVAKRLNASAFYIGCHPYMSDDEIDFVIAAFHNYFRTQPRGSARNQVACGAKH